jgi:hypothetical protein
VYYIIQILFINLHAYVVANERALLLYIAWKIVNKFSIRNRKAMFGLRGRDAFVVFFYHVSVRCLRLCSYRSWKQAVAKLFEMLVNYTVLKVATQHTELLKL